MRRLHLHSSLVLLAISVGAILVAGLQLLTTREPLPPGSSYSAQPDGLRGLYEWTESLGARPLRLDDTASAAAPALVLVVDPESLFTDTDRDRLEAVTRRGGTLVLAGESVWLQTLLPRLDITFEASRAVSAAFEPGSATALPLVAHYRVRPTDTATPLLVAGDGGWLAMREPYQGGTLVVLTTSQPLTNAGLRDDALARFVYQALRLDALDGQTVGFEERHHSFAPDSAAAPSLSSLAYQTPVGRALLYAAVVVFGWLLLGGRRLGPPLPARGATQPGRTMFEHVQTLAGLYRRAGRLDTARDAFARHYHRLAVRNAALRAVLPAIEAAQTERDLVGAVGRADQAAARQSTGSDG